MLFEILVQLLLVGDQQKFGPNSILEKLYLKKARLKYKAILRSAYHRVCATAKCLIGAIARLFLIKLSTGGVMIKSAKLRMLQELPSGNLKDSVPPKN